MWDIIWNFIKANIEVISILLSPVIAVCVTLWYQSRKEKKDAKLRLFLTLFAYRGIGLNHNYVVALNTIEVIFHSYPKVIDKWHDYHNILYNTGITNWNDEMRRAHLDLLSVMAKSLGYKKLEQKQIDKHYYPQGWGDEEKENKEIRAELLTYLKKSVELYERLNQNIAQTNQQNR